jgi:hypothetical protein
LPVCRYGQLGRLLCAEPLRLYCYLAMSSRFRLASGVYVPRESMRDLIEIVKLVDGYFFHNHIVSNFSIANTFLRISAIIVIDGEGGLTVTGD